MLQKMQIFGVKVMGAFLVLAAFFFVGCGVEVDPLPEVSKEDRALVSKASNHFALDMYKEVILKEKGNTFISPYSISSALTMTYAGAKGNTATEMAKALHISTNQKEVHKANGWLLIDLNNRGRMGNYQLSIANKIWSQQGFSFLPEFINTLKSYYLSDTSLLDFSGNPEASRATINTWVAQKTQNKIKELLPKGSISSLTKLVLTNAIYFKAAWLGEFDKKNTSDMSFYTSATDKIQVPMMTQESDKVKFADLKELQVLELPYKGEEISMFVFLPKKKDGLAALEKALSHDELQKWITAVQSQKKFRVYLPKFSFTKQLKLNKALQSMGMKQAFSRTADFSGMNGQKNLFISSVYHKAFIEVNEEGSEAAAATAVVVNVKTAIQSFKFQADHPFFFIIRDNTTGTILFLGRVINPKQ